MLLNLDNVSRRKNLISLTPLIDVVFILLLFFMLSSTFSKWHQMTLQTTTSSNSQTSDVVIVTIKSNEGDIRISDNSLSINNNNALEAILNSNLQAKYVIASQSGITLQTMVSVLDAIKKTGAEHVVFGGVTP